MQFDTGTLGRCQVGGSHYTLPITILGVTKTMSFTLDDLQGDPPADIQEARIAILDRLRSAAKEAGATTFAQLGTAINSKTFKV